MEFAKQIELAPKNGDFVVLQDAWSGSWEVGRWAPESDSWVQIDGKPLRIFPTHWVPISGDAAGSENSESLAFLVPPIQVEETAPKLLHTRFILAAFTAASIIIGGYAVVDLGSTGAGPVKNSISHKIAGSAAKLKQEVYGEGDQADVVVRDLAAAREQIALHTGREDAVQAEAEARQKKLKHALDESEAKAEALARELWSARAPAGKPFNDDVVTQDGASSIEPPNRPIRESNAAPGMISVIPNAQSLDDVRAGPPTFSNTRSAPTSTVPDDAAAGSSRPPAQPGQFQPTNTISSADEARLIDRAEFLLKQSDFAGARLLLEHALDKGSARAAFLMAETYDWRMLRALQPYGIRGDSEKARELYELAAAAGVEKARERLETLKSSSDR
jgi:hypothetical protein